MGVLSSLARLLWHHRKEKGPVISLTQRPLSAVIARSFYSKVAGVTFRNPDGRSRQRIIKQRLRAWEPLDLVTEDDNPVDPEAIAVWIPGAEQIGYLSAVLAHRLRTDLILGFTVAVAASAITGSDDPGWSLGVNIYIEIYEPFGPRLPAEIRRRARERAAKRRIS